MLSRECAVFPHIVGGKLYTYGNGQAFCSDLETMRVLEKKRCTFPHVKWFNAFLTQPTLHNGEYYATFMTEIYKIKESSIETVGELSKPVLRNCLVSCDELLLIVDNNVELLSCDLEIRVIHRKGVFFNACDQIFSVCDDVLQFLTPSLDIFEHQYAGSLICYGCGFCWFLNKKRVRMIDLSDMETWTFDLNESAVQSDSLVRFSNLGPYIVGSDLAVIERKQRIAEQKQSHYEKMNQEVAAICSQNQKLIEGFKEVDELWAGIDAAYQHSSVRFEVRKQDLQDLSGDLSEEIEAIERRIERLKASLSSKLRKERRDPPK